MKNLKICFLFIFVNLSLLFYSEGAQNIKTCNIVPNDRGLDLNRSLFNFHGIDYHLSDYWAQELIGSDFMREELEKSPPPERDNWIAVFDSIKGNHYIMVQNLISGGQPHAVLPEKKMFFVDIHRKKNGMNPYKEALSYVERLEEPPHYINNSMTWAENKETYEIFEKLSSSRSIIVSSSGNDFSDPLEKMKIKASKNFDLILVGSFSPDGFVSGFSQSGEEVFILAPSDDWITSAGKKGELRGFSGTSGAAPLVTGSLAGFEWLSGYHPTAKEAKILLEKTAIPTLHSLERPRVNGAGLLNAYKIGEVAKRLREKCRENNSCFQEEILKDENYLFDKDETLIEDLKEAFPSCLDILEPPPASACEDKKELFNRLRRETLLNPTKESLSVLSCIYKSAGFLGNAITINHLRIALEPEEGLRDHMKSMLLKPKKPLSKDELRLTMGMGGFEEYFNEENLLTVIGMMPGRGTASWPFLIEALSSPNKEIRYSAVLAFKKIAPDDLDIQLALINTLEDSDKKLRRNAAWALGEIKPENPSAQLALIEALNNPDRVVRQSVAWTLGEIKPENPLVQLALIEALNNPDGVVRQSVAWTLGEIELEDPRVLMALSKPLERGEIPPDLKIKLSSLLN